MAPLRDGPLMFARFVGLALLVVGCSKSRVTVADAATDAGAPIDGGSEKATALPREDAGPTRPLPTDLTWRTESKTLAYLRGDDLYIVDSERFIPRVKTRIPHLSYATILPLDRGGALVFGAEGESVDAQHKVVLVDGAGAFKAVDMGTQLSVQMEVEESEVRKSAIVDEEAGTFARFIIDRPEELEKPISVLLETRSLADGSVKSKTKMPAWFHARMNTPPLVLGCRGSLCAFGVAPPHAGPTFDDDRLLLALFDFKESAPRQAAFVQLGPSPDVAFGKGNMLAVTFGAGADPVLVDAKSLAIRAFGRRGGKVDVMNAAGCIAFSSDGSLLASTADHEGVSLFETATGKRRWKTGDEALSVAHWRSCGIAFGADGHVLDWSGLGNMQKLDVATGARLQDFDRAKRHNPGRPTAVGNESWLTSGALSPKASFFVLKDREAKKDVLLDTKTWSERPLTEDGVFDPEDRYFVAGEIVYDATTLQPKATLF